MYAEAISNHIEVIKNYFLAWETYDDDLLKEIFESKATYHVRPRKKIYTGIDEIIGYWDRNKKRQKNINIFWSVKESSFVSTIVYFHTKFFDVETKKVTHINGTIIFKFNSNNKITLLSEGYKKRLMEPIKEYPNNNLITKSGKY